MKEKQVNPKISVIIPCHNSEMTIVATLDSILNQSFKDFEVVCIDDGSNDNTVNTIQNIVAKDSRVKLFCQQNLGTGTARNIGIQNAQGEYISFCDSDDQYDSNMLIELYERMNSENCDIVECDYVNRFKDGTYSVDNFYETIYKIFGQQKIYNYLDKKDYVFSLRLTACNKLYKRSFILENKIQFSNCILGEDHTFIIDAFLSAQRVSYINKPLYYYNARTNFAPKSKSKNYFSTFTLYKDFQNIFIKHDLVKDKNVMQAFENYFVQLAYYNYRYVPQEAQNEYISCIKKNIEKKYVRLIINKIQHKPNTFKEFLFRKEKIMYDDYWLKCTYILNFRVKCKKKSY